MAKRPAALEGLLRTWFYPLDLHALARYQGPVYLGLGTHSHQEFERQSRRLAEIVPDAEVETYEGLHHLNPPISPSPHGWQRPSAGHGRSHRGQRHQLGRSAHHPESEPP